MQTIKSVLIAGAGAIGSLVAETIYKAEPDSISILAKGERLERYRKNGLWVNGQKLDFRLTSGGKTDLIIVASKFHHLEQIIEDIAPCVGEDTIILSLLNGISSEEIIGRRFGRERLPLAMIIGTDAAHKDESTTYTLKGVIHFGDGEGRNGEREEKIAEFFTRTGVAFKLDPDMKRTFWYKFMMNVGANQTTAILRLPYAALQTKGGAGEIPEARHLMELGMREVIAIANAEGIDLNDNDIEKSYETLNLLDPSGCTSMCQDVLAKQKTELEMFSLAVMELGKKHGIPTPVNELFYLQLRVIEKSYHRG
jgi:2-dehydropantoate 2-reductase